MRYVQANDLIKKLVRFNPEDRIDLLDMKGHPFLEGVATIRGSINLLNGLSDCP
jgi:hypothetical protein